MKEPVAISVALGTVVSSAVALLALFWPDKLTPEITAAVIVFANALIALGVAVYARSQVTPIIAPSLESGTAVRVTNSVGETTKVMTV